VFFDIDSSVLFQFFFCESVVPKYLFQFTLLQTGEIWSGSEGGVIKAWPWDAIARSLSLTQEGKHIAALLVERAYVDLRNHAAVGSMFSLPTADVKYMLADHCRAKVWSLTSMAFAIWYALINIYTFLSVPFEIFI
jgi:hypothetical protein